ncbi:hypothetical protein Hanom_Chr12g01139311 [Helianthus anomalus]
MGARKDMGVSYARLTQEEADFFCEHWGIDSSANPLHPQGVSRVFRLAKNGDWFTFETSRIDVSLISSLVTTLGSWKDRFFRVSESVVPFKMVLRHPDAVLNELEPSVSELDEGLLKALKGQSFTASSFP